MKLSKKPQKFTLPDGKIIILPSEEEIQRRKFTSEESDWSVEHLPEPEDVAQSEDDLISSEDKDEETT